MMDGYEDNDDHGDGGISGGLDGGDGAVDRSDHSRKSQTQRNERRRPRPTGGSNSNSKKKKKKLKPWDDDDTSLYVDETTGETFHATTSPWNAHGVFYVLLKKAERLPCPVGSSVSAVVSLPPFKGKVRSTPQRRNAFLGTSSVHDGVCIQWGSSSSAGEQQRQRQQEQGDDSEDDEDDDDDRTVLHYYNSNEYQSETNGKQNNVDGLCSMVNSWSSEESPVPTIHIQLMFSPLGMGLFEFTMASVDLSCHVLLRNAGVWRSRWVPMTGTDSSPSSNKKSTSSSAANGGLLGSENDERTPLMHVQAVFVPTVPTDVTSVALSMGSGYSSSLNKTSVHRGNTTTVTPPQVTNNDEASSTKPIAIENDQRQIKSTNVPETTDDDATEKNIKESPPSSSASLAALLSSTVQNPTKSTTAEAQTRTETIQHPEQIDSNADTTTTTTTTTEGLMISTTTPTDGVSEDDGGKAVQHAALSATPTGSSNNGLSSADVTPTPVDPPHAATAATTTTTTVTRQASVFSSIDDDMESVNMDYNSVPSEKEQQQQQQEESHRKEPRQDTVSTPKTKTTKTDIVASSDDEAVKKSTQGLSVGGTEGLKVPVNAKLEPTRAVKDMGIPTTIGQNITTVDDNSITDDISLTSKTIHTSATAQAPAIEPHLLRADNYWMPTHKCAVCSRTLLGRKGGFHCEACSIDVCGDCRLNVDIKVPCRSDLAQQIVAKSAGNQINVSKLLSIVAPDDKFEDKKILEESKHGQARDSIPSTIGTGSGWNRLSTTLGEDDEKSVGQLRLEIIRACLFEENIASHKLLLDESDTKSLPAVRTGDYYVRISTTGSDKNTRTPTVQNTGMPNFQAAEIKIPILHYGTQFRLDVVDANTEGIVGSTVLTTQGILQDQRDRYLASHGISLFQFLKGTIPSGGMRTIKIELRTGIKTGPTHDFLLSMPKSDMSGKDSKTGSTPGAICGWMEIDVGIEEFFQRLYGRKPLECPARPSPDFNISTFNGHISRISSLVADGKAFAHELSYLYSWKNPFVTAVSLYIFVYMSIYFNEEYWGSLPFLMMLALSLYCAFRRSRLETRLRYIQHEAENVRRAADTAFVGYNIFRPRSMVRVSVNMGRNLVSQEFGIAGRVACNVFWDAARFADENVKKEMAKVDKSIDAPINIGSTNAIYTANPNWESMEESADTKRLNQILPSCEKEFFDGSSLSSGQRKLSFPVLQPFQVNPSSGLDDAGRFKDGNLQDWKASKGAIVIEVLFQDLLNNLPGFDHVIGEVAFPFSELAKRREIKGWFHLLNDENGLPVFYEDTSPNGGSNLNDTSGPPRIYVHLEWDPPATRKDGTEPEEDEREVSIVIQEELARSSALSKAQKKFDIVGSSMGAVNTAFGIGNTLQVIQNTLGLVLDTLEAVINGFNFTDPFKSSIILVAVFGIWLILSLVPTRLLIVIGGLVPYVNGFLEEYGETIGLKAKKVDTLTSNNEDPSTDMPVDEKSPVVVWITNALRSLPTSDDLRKAYIWESRSLGAEQKEVYASQKRKARLAKLWKAEWYSNLKVFMPPQQNDGRGSSVNSSTHWSPCFAVIQGHRFLWWYDVDDFDNGELPAGRLLLSGHAGLGTPSPLEMRHLTKKEELAVCLTLFGRGDDGQQSRVTMILPDETTKNDIERVVLESASYKND